MKTDDTWAARRELYGSIFVVIGKEADRLMGYWRWAELKMKFPKVYFFEMGSISPRNFSMKSDFGRNDERRY
jgi:hypothetical protein